jgi:hypothetical protein
MTTNNRQRLIIRVGRGSLAFSTVESLNEVRYEMYALNSSISMAANMREALRSEPLLGNSYERVLVAVDAPVMMVPTELYREDEQDALYRHTFTSGDQQVLQHSVVPDLNCVAVYAMPRDLHAVIGEAFPQASFMAASVPVWQHLHHRSYTGPRNKLYAYCHEHRLEVMNFSQNRFKFYNAFTVNNADDTLYYLLAVWQQLALDATHDEMHLVGDFADGKALTERASDFVKRVFTIIPSGEFNRAPITQIKGVPYDIVTLYMKGR